MRAFCEEGVVRTGEDSCPQDGYVTSSRSQWRWRRSRCCRPRPAPIRRSAAGAAPSPQRPTSSPSSKGARAVWNPAAVSGFDDSGAQLAPGDETGTPNLTLLSNTPKPAPFETEADFNSDLAFENGYAYQGNYDGVQIYDVRQPDQPALASFIHCPGSQNDVTVNDGILVTSTDSIRNKAECEGNVSVPTTSAEYGQPTNWEGLRIFDVRTRTARSTSAPCAPTAARTPTRCCPRPAGCSSM